MKLFRAVVEDNNDPLKIGRVKVRIFGLHTQNNENSAEKFNTIKTADLPWAEVMGGTDFGLISGIGLSTVIKQGTWVWVTLNQNDPNKPIIIGTIIGTTKTRKKYSEGEGFNDKDDVNPPDARLDESDMNRLSRGEKLQSPYYDNNKSVYFNKDTIHKKINDNLDKPSSSDYFSAADVSQNEPVSLSDKTTYPNSSVLETSSGHVFEFDDTPGNERIRLYHTSGSYIEIRPDGTFVQKCVNTNSTSHYIHMNDVNEHIAKGIKRYIENDLEEIINGNIKRQVKLNVQEHINGDIKKLVDGAVTKQVKLNKNEHINGNLTLTVDGNLNWNVGGSVNISSGGTFTNTNGGNHTVSAPTINLN